MIIIIILNLYSANSIECWIVLHNKITQWETGYNKYYYYYYYYKKIILIKKTVNT